MKYLIILSAVFMMLITDKSISSDLSDFVLFKNNPNQKYLLFKSDLPESLFTESTTSFKLDSPEQTQYWSISSSLAMNDPVYKLDSGVIKNIQGKSIKWKPFDGGTIAVQVVGGAVGLVFGSLISAGLVSTIFHTSGESGLGAALLSVFGGIVVGIPAGISVSGSMMGGNGSFGVTLLGSALGFGIYLASDPGAFNFNLPVLFATNMILPIVAYHLSAKPVFNESISFNSVDTFSFRNKNIAPANIVYLNVIKVNF